MDYVRLGRSGEKVSVIGLGAWQWGSRGWGWGKEYHEGDVQKAFSKAIELGINLIDTAEIYGQGTSERILGKMMAESRDKVFIATKVWATHAHYSGVLKAAERSLERLQTNVIDLYQVHWPNPLIPIRRTMRAMEHLVKAGKVRHIGVSNFSPAQLKKAQECLAREVIVSNQIEYSLVRRSKGEKMLQYAKKEGVSIIAYSPLGKGLLSGKYRPGYYPKGWIRYLDLSFTPEYLRSVSPLMGSLACVAGQRNKTTAQVALNWLLKDPEVVVIPGVKNATQVEENAGAADWRLDSEELSSVEQALRKVRPNMLKCYVQFLFRPIL